MMLAELKGPGKLIAAALTEACVFELIRFLDYSLAIRKQGVYLELWEADRTDDCWAHFYKLAQIGDDDRVHLVVMSQDARRRISPGIPAMHLN